MPLQPLPTMSTPTHDGGNLSRREALKYKTQVLLIVALVLLGVGRGYSLKVEQNRQSLQIAAEDLDMRLSACIRTYTLDEQSPRCRDLVDQAQAAALEVASLKRSFPNPQLRLLFGSDAP